MSSGTLYRGGTVLTLGNAANHDPSVFPDPERLDVTRGARNHIAFGFGIPMAYAAVLETVPLEGWLMLAANIFWAIAYDTEHFSSRRVIVRNVRPEITQSAPPILPITACSAR